MSVRAVETTAVHWRKLTVAVSCCLFVVSIFAVVLIVILVQSRQTNVERASAYEYLIDTVEVVKASLEEEKATLTLIVNYDTKKTWYANTMLLRKTQTNTDTAIQKVLLFSDSLKKQQKATSVSPYDVLKVADIYYQRSKLRQRSTTVYEASAAFRQLRETCAGLMLSATTENLPDVQGSIATSMALNRIADVMSLELATAVSALIIPTEDHLGSFLGQRSAVAVSIASELDSVSAGKVSREVVDAAKIETLKVTKIRHELESRVTHTEHGVSSDADVAVIMAQLKAMEASLDDIFAFAQQTPPDDAESVVGLVCLSVSLLLIILTVVLLMHHWNRLESESAEERVNKVRARTMRRAVRRMERFISKLCRLDLAPDDNHKRQSQPQGQTAIVLDESEFLVDHNQADEFDVDGEVEGGAQGGAEGVNLLGDAKEGVQHSALAVGGENDPDEGPRGPSEDTRLEDELYKLETPGKILPKYLHPFVVKRYRRLPPTHNSAEHGGLVAPDRAAPGTESGLAKMEGSSMQGSMAQSALPMSMAQTQSFAGSSTRTGVVGKEWGRRGVVANDLGDKLSMYEGTVLFVSLAGFQRKPTSESVKTLPNRLNKVFEAIFKTVHEFGGTVHSVSELLVVTFNVVAANGDAARAACSCALQLLVNLKEESWLHCAVASSLVAAGFVDADLLKPFTTIGPCMQLGVLLLRLAAVHDCKLFTDERVFGQLDAQFFESRPVEIISADSSSHRTTAYEVTHTGKRAGGGGLQSEKGRSALSAWLIVFEDYKQGLFEEASMKLLEFESMYGATTSSARLSKVLRRDPAYVCTMSTLEGDESDLDNLAGLGVA